MDIASIEPERVGRLSMSELKDVAVMAVVELRDCFQRGSFQCPAVALVGQWLHARIEIWNLGNRDIAIASTKLLFHLMVESGELKRGPHEDREVIAKVGEVAAHLETVLTACKAEDPVDPDEVSFALNLCLVVARSAEMIVAKAGY